MRTFRGYPCTLVLHSKQPMVSCAAMASTVSKTSFFRRRNWKWQLQSSRRMSVHPASRQIWIKIQAVISKASVKDLLRVLVGRTVAPRLESRVRVENLTTYSSVRTRLALTESDWISQSALNPIRAANWDFKPLGQSIQNLYSLISNSTQFI